MEQLAGYLLLAICVIVHVTVLLQVISGRRTRRRVAGPTGTAPLLRHVVMPAGTHD
jgi:hypothetical protein